MDDKSIDFDVSIEIITEMIAIKSNNYCSELCESRKSEIKNEIGLLTQERIELYKGNQEILKKVVTKYVYDINKHNKSKRFVKW